MIRWLAVAVLLGSALGCNGSSRAAAPASGEAAQPQLTASAVDNGGPTSSEVRRATLTIEGMVCQGCAEATKQTLVKIDGVVSADADFQSGTTTVSFDPSRTNVDALVAAIEGVDRDPAPAFRVTARNVGQ